MQAIVTTSLNSKRRTADCLTITHLATDSVSGASVLLKTQRFTATTDFAKLVSLHDLLKSAKSSSVVRPVAYETFPKDNSFKVAFERVEGSLADLIATAEDCPFSFETVEQSLTGIAEVLKEAQGKGFAHGRISAEHCYNAGAEVGLKIGNFACEKDMNRVKEEPKRYWSTEVREWAQGRLETVDWHRADVYALAVVFLQVIHWSPLHVLEANPQEVASLLESAPQQWRGLVPRLAAMLRSERPDWVGLEQVWKQRTLCARCFQIVEGLGVGAAGRLYCSEDCRDGRSSSSSQSEAGRDCRSSSSSQSEAGGDKCSHCGKELNLPSEVQQKVCITCQNAAFRQNSAHPLPSRPEIQIPPECLTQLPIPHPPVAPSQSAASPPAEPGSMATCSICFTRYPITSPAPHPAHTSEVMDFCSPECKELWVNQEQEWAFGRLVQDTDRLCMVCAMVPVRGIPLPCGGEYHVFCSRECVRMFLTRELTRTQGDATRIRCPSCNTLVPGEVLQMWGVEVRPIEPVRMHTGNQCNVCGNGPATRRLPCGHSVCQGCNMPFCARCPVCNAPR